MNSENNNLDPKNRLNIITFLFVISLIALFMATSSQFGQNNNPTKDFTQLITDLRDQKVAVIELDETGQRYKVQLYKDKNQNGCSKDPKNLTTVNYETAGTANSIENNLTRLQELAGKENVKFGSGDCEIIYKQEAPSFVSRVLGNSLFGTLLFLGIASLIAVFLIRRLSDVNSKSISFGNSKAKMFEDVKDSKKITFADVAGNKEAKEELYQVVDFLKRPEAYIEMGAKIPKGVLLIGGPGQGKTLLAKAVAGEAGVPFLFVSGSEFVEMFVGVGASRVRDLFKQARKKEKCVIFIDEIDAVGRKRGNGLGNSNDEREQTLNQILTEMDGFEKNESIIVLAATNRPDVLDSALLRPGRFDRQVTVTSPDRKEREQILNVHAQNKKIGKNIDLGVIAKRTPGFSGADLANLMNEAAILAVAENKKEIDNECLRESIEKSMLGPSLKSKIQTEDMRKLVAYHEAGHALLATLIPEANKVQKITIVPRGRAGGYTFNAPEDDNTIIRKSQLMAEIQVLFGGYIVEQIFFKDLSTGASNDLERATSIARNMICKYGMGNLGPVSFSDGESIDFIGKGMREAKSYSEAYSKIVDDEIMQLINICYAQAKNIINSNTNKIELIANKLLEQETLELEEFNQLLDIKILTKI